MTEAHLLEVKWQITDYICPSPRSQRALLSLARLPIATHRLLHAVLIYLMGMNVAWQGSSYVLCKELMAGTGTSDSQ